MGTLRNRVNVYFPKFIGSEVPKMILKGGWS